MWLEVLRRYSKAYTDGLYRRSLAVPGLLQGHIHAIAALWLLFVLAFATFRMLVPASPIHGFRDALPILVSYGAVAVAPICGYMLARSAFGEKRAREPLDFHLSFVGRWKPVGRAEARSHPLFGPVGFLASLLIGLLLNVVVRAGEFFVAVPAMSSHAPEWGLVLFAMMTLDLVIAGFFYMVAFVMALRSVPLFPRMLLFVWIMDVFMQLLIAHEVSRSPGLPAEVVEPLVALLQGNIAKVAISISVWAPYLICSQRVNLTYRSRIPA